MSRILEVQRYIDLIRGVRTPVALQNLVSEATTEIGFDMITLFQHADISRVVSSFGSHAPRRAGWNKFVPAVVD